MGVAPAERRFPNQSPIDKSHTIGNQKVNFSAALQEADFKLVYGVASSCQQDNSDVKGIQRVIKNLQNAISTIKRFSNINSAVDALINEDVEPGKTIKKVLSIATGDIAGYVKNILGRVRGWVLTEIQNRAKKLLPFLFPGEMPSFIDKLNKGINGLSCAFAKIVRALAKTVGSLLLDLIDKYVNGPLCLVEDFIDQLLRKILGPISDAINAINALLGSAVGAITNLADSLFNAIDFVTGILSFFKCDEDKSCPIVFEIDRGGTLSQGENFLRGENALASGTKYAEGMTNGDNSGTVNYGTVTGNEIDAEFGTSQEAQDLLDGKNVGGLSFELS
jgi:hypothetical protein